MIQKEVAAGKIKGTRTFILSDNTLDRMGDIVEADGWEFEWFEKNPIVLFGHNRGFPIGTWANPRIEGGKLLADYMPAAPETSDRIDEINSLIDQNVLRAVSVGFLPKESVPLDPKDPYGGQRYTRQELLEASIVTVPANPAALQLAKSMNVSNETLSLVFGENAQFRQKDISTGEHAKKPGTEIARITRMTLSERIQAVQTALNTKRDKLVELAAAEAPDIDALEELNAQIEIDERGLAALKVSEARIGVQATAGTGVALAAAPAINRRPLGFPQPEVKASDLIVRSAVCHLLAHIGKKDIDKVLEERYPGHEATSAVTKADIAVATTTGSGWASQLVEVATAEFLALLPATAIYPTLRSMSVPLTFGPQAGNIKIPFSSSTSALSGGFVLEGDPIPVGRLTLNSTTLVPHKFGIIVPFTKEVMRYTNPALEGIVRAELLNRTSITIDTLLMDATVGSATRPAGLLYGVAAAGSAYGGGDYQAFLNDMETLLAPFDTANAGRSLALLMAMSQARHIRSLAGPNSSGFGWASQFLSDFRIIASTTVPAGTLIAIDTADFVTSTGDTPTFEASDQAVIHMSDTPLPIVDASGTAADPVRSMFQTNSVALKMLLNITWAMRRTGMVQWISGVTW